MSSKENSMASNDGVYVTLNFELPYPHQSVKKKFDLSNCKIPTIGPAGGPMKLEAGDYSYSGMHDSGPLPPANEEGAYAQLIGCVEEAQRSSNEIMTDVMKNSAKNKKNQKQTSSETVCYKIAGVNRQSLLTSRIQNQNSICGDIA